MNTKKANWMFLCIVLITIGVELLIAITGIGEYLSMTAGMVLSEAMILIPCLCFLLFQRDPMNRTLGFHKVKISNLLLIVVYTWCMMPLVTMANAFSMIFVENEIASMSDSFAQLSFPVLFFLTAINAPFCEEFVFRGAIYGSYRKEKISIKAMLLSALLFGLMHMNFNQATYAFIIGVIMCLAYEATGSLFSTMVIHFVVNAGSTLYMGLVNWISPEMLEQSASLENDLDEVGMTLTQMYGLMTVMFMFVAAVTTVIGMCLLQYIAKRCGRPFFLQQLWESRKEKSPRIVTVPLVLAVIICVAFMIWTQ